MRVALALLLGLSLAALAHAETAMVLSHEFTARDQDGNVVRDTGLEFGEKIEVDPAEDGSFSFNLKGSTAIAEGADLAIKMKSGCFAVTLEQAFESPDLFELSVSGIEGGAYYGPSLDLVLRASASLAAGVEFCLRLDRPVILRPSGPPSGSSPQSMAVTGFVGPPKTTSGPPTLRLEVSQSFSAGARLEVRLEAYCVDSERREPNELDDYVLETPVTDDRLLTALSNPGDLISPFNLIHCVWAARSFTDRFAEDVARKLRSDGELSVGDIAERVLGRHRELLASCPTMTALRDPQEGDRHSSSVASSEPWSRTELERLITNLKVEN